MCVPSLGREDPGEGNGSPLQHSFLGNPMDRGVWWARVHGVANEPDTTERLKNNNIFFSKSLSYLSEPLDSKCH